MTSTPNTEVSKEVYDVDLEEKEVQDARPEKEDMLDTDLEKQTSKHSTKLVEEPESEPEYPTGMKLATIMISLLVSLFLVALDRLIIATAIPKITDEFHSLDDIGWYASAYLITTCATQLLWGRIYTFYPPKSVFLAGIAVFEIGSLLCGVAPNSKAFIIGRAIAGIGGAGIFCGTTIILTRIIPLHRRPAFIGAFGAVFGVASITGPLLGGAFTDGPTWRWCFYINLPLGAVAAAILLFVLKASPASQQASIRQKITQLDPFGSLFLFPSTICFLLALQWGGTTYAWDNARIIALFVLAGIFAIVFIGIQIWQQENATVPPRIFKGRTIYCGVAFTTLVGGAMITLVYYLPIWFQAIKGVTAVHSGIDTLPMVLSLVVGSIAAGQIITRIGWYNPFLFICVVFLSIGAGLITTFTITTSHSRWIGYQVIFGFGLGMGMQVPSISAQATLSQKDVSTGISLMFFGQSLGGSVFAAIGQSLFANELASSLSEISGIDATTVVSAGATELRNLVTGDLLTAALTSYNGALRRAFIVALAAACFTIFPALGIEWKNIKGLKHGGPTEEPKAAQAAVDAKTV